MADLHHHEGAFLFWLLLGALALTAFVFLPYVNAVVLSAAFAIMVAPLHARLTRLFGGHEGFGAFLTVFLVFLLIFIPVVFLGAHLLDEAAGLYARLSSASAPGPVISAFVEGLKRIDSRIDISPTALELNEYVRRALEWTLRNIGAVFSGFVSAIGFLFLSLLGLFYFLRDGERFRKALVRLMPIPPNYTSAILEKLEVTVNSVVRGTLVVALAQGILAGIGFWIFNVPSPVFWAALAVVASLLPVLGTAIVMAPAVAYLFFSGSTIPAVGLAIWALVAVGLIDNILRPYLVERDVNIHPFLILLSVLGGLGLFGPLGFLMGPLVLSLLFSLLQIYATAIVKQRGGTRKK